MNEEDGYFKVKVSTAPSVVFHPENYDQYLLEMIARATQAEHSNEGLYIPAGLPVRYLLEFLEETFRYTFVDEYENPFTDDDNILKGEP